MTPAGHEVALHALVAAARAREVIEPRQPAALPGDSASTPGPGRVSSGCAGLGRGCSPPSLGPARRARFAARSARRTGQRVLAGDRPGSRSGVCSNSVKCPTRTRPRGRPARCRRTPACPAGRRGRRSRAGGTGTTGPRASGPRRTSLASSSQLPMPRATATKTTSETGGRRRCRQVHVEGRVRAGHLGQVCGDRRPVGDGTSVGGSSVTCGGTTLACGSPTLDRQSTSSCAHGSGSGRPPRGRRSAAGSCGAVRRCRRSCARPRRQEADLLVDVGDRAGGDLAGPRGPSASTRSSSARSAISSAVRARTG